MSTEVTRPGESIVDVNTHAPESFHDYDLSRAHYTTSRFGEIDVVDSVLLNPGETVSFGNVTQLDSFTLGQRFMSPLKFNRAAFFVPLRALLPRNYELAIEIPNSGDDVPLTRTDTLLPSIVGNALAAGSFNPFLGAPPSSPVTDTATIKKLMRCIAIVQWLHAPDSLLAKLQMQANKDYKVEAIKGFYSDYEDLQNCQSLSDILRLCMSNLNGSVDVEFGLKDAPVTDPILYVCFSNNLEITHSYRDGKRFINLPYCYFPEMCRIYGGEFSILEGSTISWDSQVSPFILFGRVMTMSQFMMSSPSASEGNTFNIAPLLSYQMTMAKFYTNDKIDDIYSSQSFISYIESLERIILGDSWPTFTINGVVKFHDVLSGAVLSQCLALKSVTTDDALDARFKLYMAIFAKQNSLIFKDYFSGSRPHPIAVGDTTVEVNENSVQVIDITKQIQVQRLRNFINSVGKRFPNYLAKLLGADHVGDPLPSPMLLTTMQSDVFSSKIENTGDAQISSEDSITSVLHSGDGNLRYEFTSDDYGYFFITCSYDFKRLYLNSVDRNTFILNKYDLYNPFMQYQGDQAVKLEELGYQSLANFGYVTRDMQYKTRVDVCSGAFDDRLKKYATIFEPVFYNGINVHISPAFIRARSFEFDKYYTAMTSPLLAERFHFIVKSETMLKIRRNMIPKPQILQ